MNYAVTCLCTAASASPSLSHAPHQAPSILSCSQARHYPLPLSLFHTLSLSTPLSLTSSASHSLFLARTSLPPLSFTLSLPLYLSRYSMNRVVTFFRATSSASNFLSFALSRTLTLFCSLSFTLSLARVLSLPLN